MGILPNVRKENLQRYNLGQSAGVVEYTDCIPAELYDFLPASVLDMTLNNQMVRLQ